MAKIDNLQEEIDTDLLNLEEIRKRLSDKRLYVVARRAGLTYPTVRKFAEGRATNCSYLSLVKINRYLKPEANDQKLDSRLKEKAKQI